MTTTRRSADLHGTLAAVTTPFTPDADRVDEATLQTQADRLIGAGLHGLVTTGTTGEFPTLTPQEYRRVIEAYHPAGPARPPIRPLPEDERERLARILADAGQLPA